MLTYSWNHLMLDDPIICIHTYQDYFCVSDFLSVCKVSYFCLPQIISGMSWSKSHSNPMLLMQSCKCVSDWNSQRKVGLLFRTIPDEKKFGLHHHSIEKHILAIIKLLRISKVIFFCKTAIYLLQCNYAILVWGIACWRG